MSEKRLFVIETVNTFSEVHIVEAENEEMAKKIAANSDYNASKWLGTQISNIYEYDEREMPRLLKMDTYFFDGYAAVDKEGYLYYKKMNGEVNQVMRREKIFESV